MLSTALIRPLLSASTVAAVLLAAAAMPGAAQGGHSALAALGGEGPIVTTPQVRAELVAHAPQGVQPGQPLWLGLKITHQPHWHTYWKNPGDSGLPTTLAWTLPAGFAAGEIQWPAPKRLPLGPLTNFGYEGVLLLPVPVTVPAGFTGDALAVKLRADWLVCKDVCIPEGGDFALTVPARASSTAHAVAFGAAAADAPVALSTAQARAAVEGDALVVRASGLPPAWQGKPLAFFPETPGVIQNAAEPDQGWNGGEWTARIPLDIQRSESPTTMPAVLTAPGLALPPSGVALQVAVTTPWPATAAATPAPAPALGDAVVVPAAAAPGVAGVLLAMGLALLGGALLNLMPCVFPVLALKVMGFAHHGGDRRALLTGGLAYTAGVVLSFVALAGLLLALRAGGEQLGWGFQLQQPAFVALLAALFTLIALNLAGVFEIGSVLPSSLETARVRNPVVDSLLTGVLAVAVASPCTAPFMGASLGLAVTLPAWQALAVFAALGLGMALPYLVLCAWPALAARLPRPGAWMAHFKVLMAFPMLATVVWLVWVLGSQVGIDGAAALLAVLVALAFAAWALGSATLGRGARRGFGALALALLAAAVFWAAPSWRQEAIAAPDRTGATAEAGERWQPWSPERVQQALAAGQPVFVDFTAAWCVTCQFNKRTTLAAEEVLGAFDGKRVLLLRADWTRRDAAIAAELSRLGRNGVPVYALYAPGGTAPTLLPEILTPDAVRGALAQLPG
jgi:thiol:disulfide interchange protein DsbD